MAIFEERKKEIIFLAIYALLFGVLFFCIYRLTNEKQDLEAKVKTVQTEENRLRSNTVTEAELEVQLSGLESEEVTLKNILPNNLTNQDINSIMEELVKSIGMFNYNSYQIGKSKTLLDKEKNPVDEVECYEVMVTTYSGSYTQLKRMLNFIDNYPKRININNLIINNKNGQLSGSFSLIFYNKISE